MTSQLSIYCKDGFLHFLKNTFGRNALDGFFGKYQHYSQNKAVSATLLYMYIDSLIMCRVNIFRLPDIVFGVVSDYVISLLVAIK